MKNRQKFVLLLAMIISTVGVAVAKKCNDDFSQEDYNRILKGEKNFIGAKLEEANLQGLNLSGCDFRGADLEKANLQNANLTNADFTNADLEDVNLKGAKVFGTIFKGAELEFATWTDGKVCAEDSVGSCW